MLFDSTRHAKQSPSPQALRALPILEVSPYHEI
jgi:hypothetical protein